MKKTEVERGYRIWKVLLVLGSIAAALKVIFVDYTLDEEYQIVMAYRNLMGDSLFGTMWEPHQTSAFACVWLMRLFRAVTGGTTGVVLFLRVCTTLIQILLAWWLYRVCRDYTRKEYAFLLGLCYFNIVPKIIQIPEFSNLQLWFFTVIVLALMRYYGKGNAAAGRRCRLWLVLAGTGMALEVLSYPSCLILFPYFLACIALWSRGGRTSGGTGGVKRAWADCLIFAGVCVWAALIWLGYVLSHVTPEEFLRNIRYVLHFDLTHDVSLVSDSRLVTLASSVKSLVLPLLVIVPASLALWAFFGWTQRKGGQSKLRLGTPVLAVIAVLAAELVQLFYWIILKKGYEEPLIHLLVLLLAAALVWRDADARKKILVPGLLGGAISILVVVYMSDLAAWYAIPHGMLGSLFAALVIIYALEGASGDKSGDEGQGRRWIYVLLVSLVAVSIFGKGFTLRAGKTETNSILGVRGIVREGPATGIFTNYMQAYITNSAYEEFEEYVEAGTNCLIVTNMAGTAGTSPYLFRDCNICHFSIVDPTSYDERLLTYWGLYPEKRPDLIVVDCWYGQLMEAEDNWIMRYIENDFQYDRVEEGKFLRYYFR